MNDMTHLLTGYGGLVFFAVVFGEQAGLPVPGGPCLLAAGALAANGGTHAALVIGMTVLAAVMADSLWFWLGRRGDGRVLRLFCRLSLSRNSSIARTKGVLARHGLVALVAAKFLPGLGTVMPPLAGALGMSIGRFLVFDGLGALIWGSFYVAAGYLFHNQIREVMTLLDHLGVGAMLLGLALLVGFIAYKCAVRRGTLVRQSRWSNTPDKKTGFADVITSVAHPDPANLVTGSSLEVAYAPLAGTGSNNPMPVATPQVP